MANIVNCNFMLLNIQHKCEENFYFFEARKKDAGSLLYRAVKLLWKL